MTIVEPTWSRCVKIWWSFAWRAMLLTVPVMFVMMGVLASLLPFPKPGQSPAPFDPARIGLVFTVGYPLMLALVVGAQVAALRWMLRRQRWQNFFVALIPAPDPAEVLQRQQP